MQGRLQNIHRTQDLCIDYFRFDGERDHLLITFTEFTNRRLDGYGFGGTFASEHKFDLISIKSGRDDWYQLLPMAIWDEIEACVGASGKRYKSRATYGSSMGGFAAIYHALHCKANVALALSPQFDITAGWDTRWGGPAAKLESFATLTSQQVSPDCKYVVAFDPFDRDRRHFDLFASVIPAHQLLAVPVPFAGHPVGYMLKQVGCLKPLASSVLTDGRVIDIRTLIRAGRKSYAPYYFHMAGYAMDKKKFRLAEAALGMSIEIDPFNAESRIKRSVLFMMINKIKSSIEDAALAVALNSQNYHMRAQLARVLKMARQKRAALEHIEICLTLGGDLPALVALRDHIEHGE